MSSNGLFSSYRPDVRPYEIITVMQEQQTTKSVLALLTPQEVADRLRIPKATLYSWRYQGKGPVGWRVGKHLRYSEDSLDNYINVLKGGAQ